MNRSFTGRIGPRNNTCSPILVIWEAAQFSNPTKNIPSSEKSKVVFGKTMMVGITSRLDQVKWARVLKDLPL
jgi:hypothetical protein